MIAKVEHEGKFLRFAMVQYTVNMTPDGAKLLFSQTKRHSGTQVRTKPSVLERVRQSGDMFSAKKIINHIQKEAGGVVSIWSPSNFSRDRQQVYKNNESQHLTTLAAAMTSVSKETRDYEYLARSLKKIEIESLTYGTEGECVLERGFDFHLKF